MNFYQSPETMFSSRAYRFQRYGNQHWAMAKNGCGNHHYSKAMFYYEQAATNHTKTTQVHTQGATFQSSSKG